MEGWILEEFVCRFDIWEIFHLDWIGKIINWEWYAAFKYERIIRTCILKIGNQNPRISSVLNHVTTNLFLPIYVFKWITTNVHYSHRQEHTLLSLPNKRSLQCSKHLKSITYMNPLIHKTLLVLQQARQIFVFWHVELVFPFPDPSLGTSFCYRSQSY